MTTALANPIVVSSVVAVIGALFGGLFGWLSTRKKSNGDYVGALMSVSKQFTEQVMEQNRELNQKVDRLEQHVDALDGKLVILTDLLIHAIPSVEAAGDHAHAAAMRAAIRGGQPT